MLNKKDLYTYNDVTPITVTTDDVTTTIGTCINRYEVRKYIDVRNLTETDCYIVDCTQRIVIPNPSVYAPIVGIDSLTEFVYPALLENQISIRGTNMVNYYLLQYSPKTLNTTVMTDNRTLDSNESSYSKQHTSGSSISQTNNYGVLGSTGFFGNLPAGGISGSFENSNISRGNSSKTTSQDVQKANSDSMSMKDWGSYSTTDAQNQIPTWIWAQEYPWNVMQFRGGDVHGNIILPDWVKQRLCDGTQLYPPTELSLLGIDFVSKASWLIQMGNIEVDAGSNIVFNHTVNYFTASHTISGTAPNCTVTASITDVLEPPLVFISQSLDLAQLALDAITSSAATGFTLSQFTFPPQPPGVPSTPFEIVSRSNNLLVRGSGFDSTMIADFSTGAATLDIYFKITDNDVYTLFLKCWKTTDVECTLSITINGDANNIIYKNVNDLEYFGGEDNMVSIILRNLDYTSAEYYDYLQFGINHILIAIDPSGGTPNSGFQLRTVAIG